MIREEEHPKDGTDQTQSPKNNRKTKTPRPQRAKNLCVKKGMKGAISCGLGGTEKGKVMGLAENSEDLLCSYTLSQDRYRLEQKAEKMCKTRKSVNKDSEESRARLGKDREKKPGTKSGKSLKRQWRAQMRARASGYLERAERSTRKRGLSG